MAVNNNNIDDRCALLDISDNFEAACAPFPLSLMTPIARPRPGPGDDRLSQQSARGGTVHGAVGLCDLWRGGARIKAEMQPPNFPQLIWIMYELCNSIL